jgi:hypothetical protein
MEALTLYERLGDLLPWCVVRFRNDFGNHAPIRIFSREEWN